MGQLSDKDLVRKLEEVRDLLERSNLATRTVSDGDGPVWVLDQALDRLSELAEASENGNDGVCGGGDR